MPDVSWQPTQILDFIRQVGSSTGPCVVNTDSGRAYVKAPQNNEGPHALVCDWLGTYLARWFGLPCFETAIVEHDGITDLPLKSGGVAEAGPVFATREVFGEQWDGKAASLDRLVNPDDLTRLVLFDTWIRNRDRYRPARGQEPARINLGNVFLAKAGPGRPAATRLMAIDHTHVFSRGAELTRGLSDLSEMQDETVYGLFPAFFDRLRRPAFDLGVGRLREFSPKTIREPLDQVPEAWQLGFEMRKTLTEFLSRRAAYVADTIENALGRHMPASSLFPDPNTGV